MSAAEIHNDAMRRCFVLAPAGGATEAVIGLLTESGIECLRPDELLSPGAIWSNELTQHLARTDASEGDAIKAKAALTFPRIKPPRRAGPSVASAAARDTDPAARPVPPGSRHRRSARDPSR